MSKPETFPISAACPGFMSGYRRIHISQGDKAGTGTPGDHLPGSVGLGTSGAKDHRRAGGEAVWRSADPGINPDHFRDRSRCAAS